MSDTVRRIALAGVLSMAATMPALATSIVTELDTLTITATVADTPGPPQSARLFWVVHTCIYEAWQAYDETAEGCLVGNSLDGTGGPATTASKTEACAHAGYAALLSFFPTQKPLFDSFMSNHGYDPTSNSLPAILGRNAAGPMLDRCSRDGSNQAISYADTTGYKPRPTTVLDSWQPITVGGVKQSCVAPHWRNVTPFALTHASQFRPPAPPAYGTPEYNAAVQQLIDISAHLTDEQKVISDYWKMEGQNSRTPPGHLALLAQDVSASHGYGIDEDAKLFFVLTSAVHDVGIAAWEAKRYYDYARPINSIRNLGHVPIQAWGGPGLGTQTVYADQWLPYQPVNFVSPPFPEYISGHASFTAAWAEILKDWTGSDDYGLTVSENYLPIDSQFIPTVTLQYPTFTSAALASGISRLYGGIHWSFGNDQGQILGRKAAAQAWDKAQTYFNGTARPSTAALTNLNTAYWTPVQFQEFAAPAFSLSGGLGMVATTDPANTFGFWQTDPLDALAEGDYRLAVSFTPTAIAANHRHPELRIRVLREDNTVSAMTNIAQTSPSQVLPASVHVPWESDGVSRFRVAIDLLSFSGDQEGGMTITAITNERIF